MKNKFNKIIALMITAGLTVGISSVTALAAPNEEIGATKAKITEVGQKIRNTEEKISVLTEKIIAKTEEINKNTEVLEKLNVEITETENNIAETEGKLKEQEVIYGDRLRQNYKAGPVSTIKTILGADNFADLLMKIKVIQSISAEDHKLIVSITNIRNTLVAKGKQLADNKNEKIKIQAKLEDDKSILNKDKETQVVELDNMEKEKENLFALLGNQEVALFDNIKAILGSSDSSEEDIKNALAVINSIKNQVTTNVALSTAEDLNSKADSKLAAIEEKKAAAIKARAQEASKIETSYSGTKSSGNMTFYLSFYTDLPEENGGYTTTATGAPLVYGVVASNAWPLYTKIYLEGWGTMTVLDRGGSDFNSPNRLDVMIPRKAGESNAQYKRRIMILGRQTTSGYIVR